MPPPSCDARRDDTGLIAAIVMGVALANLPGIDLPEDRRFFKTVVQMVIGLLFISISATVTTTSVRAVLGPTLVLIAGLVLLVRPWSQPPQRCARPYRFVSAPSSAGWILGASSPLPPRPRSVLRWRPRGSPVLTSCYRRHSW